ncbi:hypothetical protein EHS17_03885 [Rhodobacteraceae bacterium CH30]|nr:hypothetical protein EHS17_03885 [Rhodobacteraceae bacterium CH30]
MTNAITTTTTLKNAPIITMGNIKMPQVVYKGQPVLTARAVAEVLGTDPDNVQQSYSRNRPRFLEGKHVHVLTAAEAKALGFLSVSSKSNLQFEGLNFFRYAGKGMTLFTREGVGLLSTVVSTDKAWAMRDMAWDAYFTLEGLATGALSVQEGAQKAQEVVSKGSVALPGIQMYSALRCPLWPLRLSISPLQHSDTVENSYSYF